MRPLDRLPSIRAKLGSTIVLAVTVTLVLVFVFVGYTLRNSPRDSEVLALLALARQQAQGQLKVVPAHTRLAITQPDGTVLLRGADLKVDVPRFADEQSHWGITNGIEYVSFPHIVGGAHQGQIVVMRPAPGEGFSARLSATFGFLRGFWWQFLLAGAVSALVALFLARWLARGMTRPLRQMARAAKSMAAGDYSQRVETTSRDEVGQLAETFNAMAGELAGTERLRRDLVANVSHELKTPITALRAHLENLLDGVEQPDPATLEVMLDQSDRLSRLVEQLLELSRLESGDLPLHREPMPLRPLVERVVSEVAVARRDEGVAVHNQVPADLSDLDADRERVHQVLFNLLDNAVRFTPEGGDVTVTAARENGRCVVSVSDTGPGVDAEHLPRLFERFCRVDPARSRAGGGTGIGLAIAKSVVEAHGGHIWAESSPGHGSAFRFDLPVAAPVAVKERTAHGMEQRN